MIDPAGSLGMKTITWDVDPRDWSLPDSGAYLLQHRRQRRARARSSSCTHQAPALRDETLAALPEVIDTLRARGYGFETVSALLGDELIYRPYG